MTAAKRNPKSTVLSRLLLCIIVLLLSLFSVSCNASMSRSEFAPESQTLGKELPVMAETQPQPRKKRVALTLDDGPQHYVERTKLIVDELSKYGFHATFFVVGNRIPGGDALAYAVEHANEIGIHGFTHTNSSSHYYDTCTDEVYRQELEQTAEAIRRAVPGYNIRLMRPVGGRISDERINACPYSVILWSVDSADWQHTYNQNDTDESAQEKVDTIVENVMSTVSDGDIILMHDIYESTYDAIKIILKQLYDAGYEVVTVSELLGDDLAPGQAYRFAP